MVSVHMHTCAELNINHHSSSAHHVKDLPYPMVALGPMQVLVKKSHGLVKRVWPAYIARYISHFRYTGM